MSPAARKDPNARFVAAAKKAAAEKLAEPDAPAERDPESLEPEWAHRRELIRALGVDLPDDHNPTVDEWVAALESVQHLHGREQEVAPANVIEALAAIMRRLPAIGKDAESPQGYNYRGIEAITQHVQPLLGEYRVVFAPRVINRQIVDITVNNKPWTDTILDVEYDVYGPGGIEDKITVGPVVGIGRDNSDKGANKALTQAFKYALIQTLCIGDKKDDPDAHVATEADGRGAAPDPAKEARNEAARRIKALPDELRSEIGARCEEAGMGRTAARWTDNQFARVNGWLAELEDRAAEVDQDPSGDPDGTEGHAAGSDAASGQAAADPEAVEDHEAQPGSSEEG